MVANSNNDSSNADVKVNAQNDYISEHEVRIDKARKMQSMGINPWPNSAKVTSTNKAAIDNYSEDQIQFYSLTGRIMGLRLHGKTAFLHIQDRSGQIQVYLRQDKIGEKDFKFFKDLIDTGDIIWVEGNIFKTKMGEVTLKADRFKLLSKSLYPLPEKFHGLTDKEKKYRQRYLDLIVNSEAKDRFIKRISIINTIRTYLNNNSYLEVETPILHPIAGGASAKPFMTHHNALGQDFSLRIAPELYLKRLIVGGLERVYEINRNFRNEGISTKHNPEFTMLEFYTANEDYNYAMNVTEDLVKKSALAANENLCLNYADHTIDFSKKFRRLAVYDAVKEYGKFTDEELSKECIDSIINKHNIKVYPHTSYGEKLFLLFEEFAESKLIQPTFIIDFPIETSPLAKKDPKNPKIANRFELYIAGMEISNGFNELNDPFDQAERFKEQLKAYEGGDEEAHQYDADYIQALEHAMPPTAGVGIGIDRLTMILTDTTSIKEVILFPTLKSI